MNKKVIFLEKYCQDLLKTNLDTQIKSLYGECRVDNAFSKATFFLDILYASNLGFYQQYIDIWMGSGRSFQHRRDSRSTIEYAQELVISWMIEDITTQLLKNKKIPVTLSGGDCDRNILIHPSSSSDIKVDICGQYQKIEIVSDFTGFWQRTGYIDLRDHKYQGLKNEDANILGIDFQNQQFLFFGSNTISQAQYLDPHPQWSKPAYRLHIGTQVSRHTFRDVLLDSNGLKKSIFYDYVSQ